MCELVTKSVAQEQQEQKIETHTAVERIAGFTIVAIAVAALAVLVATAVYAQGQDKDKYSLKSRFPTSGDTRTGRWSLPPGPRKYSR